jgi:hypothetical protein
MEELPKLYWSMDQLLAQEEKMVDHGPCPRCNAERKTRPGQAAVPHGIPGGFCELCYHYVLAGGRILSDDTYELYELNSKILFKGSYEECARYVKDKKEGRLQA